MPDAKNFLFNIGFSCKFSEPFTFELKIIMEYAKPMKEWINEFNNFKHRNYFTSQFKTILETIEYFHSKFLLCKDFLSLSNIMVIYFIFFIFFRF